MKENTIFRRLLSLLLAAVLCLTILPWQATAADGATYSRIYSAAELVSGKYVLVASSGYGLGALDGSWVTVASPAVSGDTVTNDAGAAWTITVTGTGVTLQDASGNYIAPKGGNSNGISSGQYSWAVGCEGGMFTFSGQGEDTVILASNVGSSNKFRAYKTTTVSGNPNGYPSTFALYKLDEAVVEPESTEPVVTEPEVTEPAVTEPVVTEPEVTEPEVTEPEAPTGTVWTKVSLSDIQPTDTIAITMTKGEESWALYNGNGTSSAPTAVVVTVSGSTMTSSETNTISWNIVSGEDGLVIYVAGSTASWLYSNNSNNGTRVGDNDNKYWTVDDASGYLLHKATSRYLGVYTNNPDWRAYKNTTGNTAGQTLSFWRLGEGSTTEPEVTEPTEPDVTEPEVTEPSEPTVTEPTVPDVPAMDYPTDSSIVDDIAQWSGSYTEEAAALKYAWGDKYIAGDKQDSDALLTVRAGGSTISPYYLPGSNGYMGGSNIGKAQGDYIQLAFSTAGWGDMTLAFRLRASNAGAGSFQLCYSVDGGSTWANFTTGAYAYSYTQYTSTGSFSVTETGDITDGVARTSMASGNYISFSFDVPTGAENCGNLLIRLIPGSQRANGAEGSIGGNIRMDSVVVSGSPIVHDSVVGFVTVVPDGSTDQPIGTELTMTTATEGAVISYRIGGGQWQTYDPENKPALTSLPADIEVKASRDGKDSITLIYSYGAGAVENVMMTPNGGGVYVADGNKVIRLSCTTDGTTIRYATSADGVNYSDYLVYGADPEADAAALTLKSGFGKLWVKAYAEKDGYSASAEILRLFTERDTSSYQLYFGQLHSHTNISDGSGTITQAYEHAYNVPNLDFLAVTDHSNYFDNANSGALGTDGSTVSEKWKQAKEAAIAITDETFVGLYGFEMTWSNGLGHLNTFNTPGWQSRGQDRYTTYSTALQNYYDDLVAADGSISQFNHPGTTFGDFSDFAHYSAAYDQVITLIEVGNGSGAIGSSGYFPSYEYYTRALDKGWHVAPTNNQDNHHGNWGNANTGRSVVLADSLTEEGIYDALRSYRVYATEDNDLHIYYHMDGRIMGSILTDVGETAEISVALYDATDSAIGKVEVIVNGGLSIAQQNVTGNSETVTFQVPTDYSYYYIKITQTDGDIAVTAPVWVEVSEEPTDPSNPTEPEDTEPTEPSTEPSEPEETTEPSEPETTEATEPSQSETTKPTKPTDGSNAQTGDRSGVVRMTITMTLSVMALAVLVLNRKKLLTR